MVPPIRFLHRLCLVARGVRRAIPLVLPLVLWMLGVSMSLVSVSLGQTAATPAPPAARTTPPAAALPPAPPAALQEYMGRQIAPTMHYEGAPWLVRDSRQREEDCRTMLAQLGVQPGMDICDMGCGNGFYTLQLAELVGEQGQVFAVDIQPEMLRLLQARAGEEKLKNIELVLGTENDPKLPAESCDLILCVDVYHEFSQPEPMLAAMHRALRPNGRLVLLEFRAEDPEVPIKPLHKMSHEQAVKELAANRFELAEQFDGLPWQHMLFFKKSPAPAQANPAASTRSPK